MAESITQLSSILIVNLAYAPSSPHRYTTTRPRLTAPHLLHVVQPL